MPSFCTSDSTVPTSPASAFVETRHGGTSFSRVLSPIRGSCFDSTRARHDSRVPYLDHLTILVSERLRPSLTAFVRLISASPRGAKEKKKKANLPTKLRESVRDSKHRVVLPPIHLLYEMRA